MNWLWLCVLISVLCSWFSFACSFQGIPKLAILILSLSRGSGFPFLLIKDKNSNCWSWNMCNTHIVCVREIRTLVKQRRHCVGWHCDVHNSTCKMCWITKQQFPSVVTRVEFLDTHKVSAKRDTPRKEFIATVFQYHMNVFLLIDWLIEFQFQSQFEFILYHFYRYMLIELVCCLLFVVWYLMFGIWCLMFGVWWGVQVTRGFTKEMEVNNLVGPRNRVSSCWNFFKTLKAMQNTRDSIQRN